MSQRLRRFGMEVLVGDLVVEKNQDDLLEVASIQSGDLAGDEPEEEEKGDDKQKSCR